MKLEIRYFLCALLLFCSCVLYQPGPATTPTTEATGQLEVPKVKLTEPSPDFIGIKTACGLLYQGKFDTAAERIEAYLDQDTRYHRELNQLAPLEVELLTGLAEITAEYKGISQQRVEAREAAYAERLAELEKFRVAAETGDVGDVNDGNDISTVLSVIARACEFADEQQRDEFLFDSFVKQTIQEVKAEAAEFESKGKWLDAYITCYGWLQAIEPDNEEYSDHAELLIEKSNILAYFQDSPCETSKERYENVEKRMFIRAVGALNFNYVSSIDYRQMAIKAIRRCKLLAEVIDLSFAQNSESGDAVSLDEGSEQSFSPPDSKKLATWSAALTVLLDEVNQLPTVSKDKFIDVFEKVLALNKTTAELPEGVLIAQFAEAALKALDIHTVMIWPRQVREFEKTMTNEFTGIGIEISKPKGLLTVTSLLPDTPAYYSGLDAEDVIEAVDGVETKDMTLICAVHRITGPKGTEVTLTVRRPGQEQTRDITITRARIVVSTIRGWQRTERGRWLYMVDDVSRIGYVRITNFSEKTTADFERVLGQLEAEGLKGLVLDLRSNTGGLLSSAIEVTDKFIREGLIVSTRPRFGIWTYASAHREKTHPDYPLVVLINSSSASASEIVAGALADQKHNRAILVGERTHGKGSVQGITHHPRGGAQLKYTMAYYHLPSGQRVESRDAMKKRGRKDWGIKPNIEVKLRSDERKKKFDMQRVNDVLVRADHDDFDVSGLKKHTAEEILAADSQLAVGVLVIKSKLIENSVKRDS